ncbi:O-antigen ligase family protein [Loktanella sp. R86503]|uniref:O-antigen ligase family protein n=1 Tax=Loktanella sp. R86503 TaxID=3093847 RepID=UPI0036DDE18D
MNDALIVGVIGSFLNALVFMLPGLKKYARYAFENKEFSIITAVIFMLLTWPTGVREAFGQGDALGLARIVRVFAFLVIFSYLALKNPPLPSRHETALIGFSGYVLICFISSFYAPSMFETIWKSFELLVLLLFAMRIRRLFQVGLLGIHNVVSIFLVFCMIAVVNAMIGAVIFPAAAYSLSDNIVEIADQSMGGIFPQVNPNSLSQYSAMIILFSYICMISFGKIEWGYISAFGIGFYGLIMAHSRTSAIAVIAIIFLISFFKGTKRSLPMILTIFCLGLLLIPVIFEFIARGQSTDVIISMSGRTYMWAIGWEAFLERPFLGHGFYSGHKSLDISIGMEFSSLDSTYLETLVNVGLIGTAMLLLLVFTNLLKVYQVLKSASRRVSDESFWWFIASSFILMMFIRSLTGPSFQVLHVNLLFALCFAACGAPRKKWVHE